MNFVLHASDRLPQGNFVLFRSSSIATAFGCFVILSSSLPVGAVLRLAVVMVGLTETGRGDFGRRRVGPVAFLRWDALGGGHRGRWTGKFLWLRR